MSRILAVLALIALFFLHPLFAIVAFIIYAARRHVSVYISLWLRLVRCDKTAPLASTAGLAAALITPYGEVAKLILISLGAFATYIAPIAPRMSRAMSIFTVGLAAPVDPKILVVAAAVAAAFSTYRLRTCGYICQKSTALPTGDLALLPDLGVACVFTSGGRDLANVYLRLGERYVKCRFFMCREVGREEFSKAVGTIERYLVEPSREVFRGLMRVVSTPEAALRVLTDIFDVVVVVSDKIDAVKAKLSSARGAPPEAVSCIAGGIYRLSQEEKTLLEELLLRGTVDEVAAWAVRLRWLEFLLKLQDGAGGIKGVVKSVFDGELGLIDSLIFAVANRAPLLTDSDFVASVASRCGALVFQISDRAQGDFVVVGPAALGDLEVGAGGYVVHVGGEYYGGRVQIFKDS